MRESKKSEGGGGVGLLKPPPDRIGLNNIFLVQNLYLFIKTFAKIHKRNFSDSYVHLQSYTSDQPGQPFILCSHLCQRSLTSQVNWGSKSIWGSKLTGGPIRCTPSAM